MGSIRVPTLDEALATGDRSCWFLMKYERLVAKGRRLSRFFGGVTGQLTWGLPMVHACTSLPVYWSQY